MKRDGPEIFYDADVARGIVRPLGAQRRQAVANPARIAATMLGAYEAIPGWPDFQQQCGALAQLAATPGWEDNDAKKTHPGAAPIGMAQWGAAIATAGTLAQAIEGALWPAPGVDPAGFIWLNWRRGDAEFSLELHASLLHQSYKWRRIVDGAPREHDSPDLGNVIEALKTFFRSVTTAQ